MTGSAERLVKQIETLKSLRFGVEIETVGLGRDAVAAAVHSVVGGNVSYTDVYTTDGRCWKVVYDGSIGDRGAEIVTPILNYADIETLQDVVRAVRRAGAQVDESCGIHIHVDAAAFKAAPKKLQRLVKLVHRQEDLIMAALEVSGSRKERYCRKMADDFADRIGRRAVSSLRTLNQAWYGSFTPSASKYHSSRYHGLNLHAVWYLGTVEFRYFNGTLHAGRIKAYVQFCLAVCAKALTMAGAFHGDHAYNAETGKYDMRIFLLRLGLRGAEFETCRRHMLAHLKGCRSRGRVARSHRVAVDSDSNGYQTGVAA